MFLVDSVRPPPLKSHSFCFLLVILWISWAVFYVPSTTHARCCAVKRRSTPLTFAVYTENWNEVEEILVYEDIDARDLVRLQLYGLSFRVDMADVPWLMTRVTVTVTHSWMLPILKLLLKSSHPNMHKHILAYSIFHCYPVPRDVNGRTRLF